VNLLCHVTVIAALDAAIHVMPVQQVPSPAVTVMQ
jgi:hypothetical protein